MLRLSLRHLSGLSIRLAIRRLSRHSFRLPLRRLFVLILVSAPSALLSAREAPAVNPSREGFSAERLQRLSTYMGQRVDDGTMVGGMGLIARNGRIVYQQTWGQADREAGRPMASDAIFRIYSMSKPITAVALLILYEEGRFLLNEPVARYLPELANLQVALSTATSDTQATPAGTTSGTPSGSSSGTIGGGAPALTGKTRAPVRQPTIRDLLKHTAGFTYGIFGNTEVDKAYRQARILANDIDLTAMVTTLGTLPLQYDPGTRWHYSVAVDIQGRLVEVLSGMKFSEFLKKRLFDPLDMRDTGFVVPAAQQARLAQLYSPTGTVGTDLGSVYLQPATGTGLQVADPRISAGYINGAAMESGGAGLVSTARDYLRFTQMLLNRGQLDGVRILAPKTIDLMTTNHLGGLPMGIGARGSGFGFGLGVAVVLDAGDTGEVSSAGEYNWGGAAGTSFWVDPTERLIGIFMVQSLPHRTQLGAKFKVLTYQAMMQANGSR